MGLQPLGCSYPGILFELSDVVSNAGLIPSAARIINRSRLCGPTRLQRAMGPQEDHIRDVGAWQFVLAASKLNYLCCLLLFALNISACYSFDPRKARLY